MPIKTERLTCIINDLVGTGVRRDDDGDDDDDDDDGSW